MATQDQTYSAPAPREAAFTQVLTRAYTLNWEAIAYTVILVLALVTRFVDLGARVMSHDESLHTYYSWRLYEFGEFQHTPLMHGPVIFHMTALNYFLFGDNDFTARIYPAVLSVLLVMFPLLFRRWLGRIGAVVASVLMLISPMMMYYGRYIREDTPSVFFTIVFVYAALQYIDGERPRRPVWLLVMAGGLLLSLASKEVGFIYVAIFGSFWTLFLALRLVQEPVLGLRRSDVPAGARLPLSQVILGHVILLGIAAILSIALGSLLRYLFSASVWIPPSLWPRFPLLRLIVPFRLLGISASHPPDILMTQIPLFPVIYLPLLASGWLRNLRRREGPPRDGAASAIMRGLSNGRSALYIIVTGLVIGVIVTLVIICVLDVIKPEAIWKQTTLLSSVDSQIGANGTKEYALETGLDLTMFVRMLTWIGLPVLIVLFVVFLSAVFIFPGWLPLPWREILLIVLVALVTTSGLVTFERRSFVSETANQPFAANPNAQSTVTSEVYNNNYILVSWVIATLIALAAALSRMLTNWWDVLHRQPMFDVLIVVGTLILPWLAAYPLWRAGYNLEEYNPNTQQGRDTLNAALTIFIPFALVSLSVGLSWNWRRWIPAAAVFLGLFVFFFTTVFSNQYGLATGMIGSLGYWLEQQGVRRGSQPQYYYILTQLPVYEFLPLLLSMLAGVAGVGRLWRWRRERAEEIRKRKRDAALADLEPPEAAPAVITGEAEVIPVPPDEEADADSEEEVPEGTDRFAGLRFWWTVSPFSAEEEAERRASDPEWVGSLPFLGMLGYWAVTILLGLTIAGEKMPWLTTHLTVPLILIGGWWLGRVIEGIHRDTLRGGGWLVLLVALPLAFVGLAHVLVPLWGANPPFLPPLWGAKAPFQGRTPDQLATTGTWLAALFVFLAALYLIGRFGRSMGLNQLGRVVILSGALILALLTARAAVLASFINYDYATEFLVYAHGGPAVKTVMKEVDRIAQITNEGDNMRIVFDDESSWPYTWYLRHYTNYGYLRGEAGSVDPTSLDGARVVIVGSKKAGDVRRILGDRYYEFGYIRLWWPMQEYFNLNYDRVANVFSTDPNNVAARYYREGLFDIWWNRDYTTYGQAMCIEDKQKRCEGEAAQGATPEDQERYRNSCHVAVVSECRSDNRFDVSKWPVSDRMYVFIDKQVAAEVWDAGIGSSSVNIREPEYPEDQVYTDRSAEKVFGGDALGMIKPRGIVVGPEGTIYVADTEGNRILVLNTSGEQIATIGAQPGGTGDAGALRQPWGLDLGPDGHLYVADTWNHRVQVFDPATGDLLRTWGHEGVPPQDPSTDALWGPRDLKVGPGGNVYVADTGNKRIRVYTPEGEWVKDIGSAGTALGQLDEPVGLAFNPVSGDLYVAEAWNKRIQVFDPNGFPLRAWDVNMWFTNRESYNRPYLAVSPDGTLIYTTDMDDHHRIVAYNLEGVPILSFNQPADAASGVTGLTSPAGLDFDAQGRLYVVDADQGKVYVFPPSEMTGGILPQALPASPLSTAVATEEVTEAGPVATESALPATEEAIPLATEAPAG